MRCFGLAVVAMAMGVFTVNSVNAQDEVLYTIGKTATAPVIDFFQGNENVQFIPLHIKGGTQVMTPAFFEVLGLDGGSQ